MPEPVVKWSHHSKYKEKPLTGPFYHEGWDITEKPECMQTYRKTHKMKQHIRKLKENLTFWKVSKGNDASPSALARDKMVLS